MTEPSDKLRWTTKLLYGFGDVGNAINNSAIQFFLMIFYTDAVLVSPAIAANALLIGKIWDGAGGFSRHDHRRALFGRHAWCLRGAYLPRSSVGWTAGCLAGWRYHRD